MRRLFWSNFFSLVLVFVAVAEWACAVWLLGSLAGLRVPSWLHVLAPTAVYVLNRFIVARPLPRGEAPTALRRAYTGVAFTSIFGFAFLLLLGALWGVARAGLGVADLAGLPAPIGALGGAARALGTAGLLIVGGAMAYGYGPGQRRVWVNRFEITMPGLAGALDGLRLVQISDIHLGAYMTSDMVAGYVDRVNALEPDVIAITGDITDGLQHAHQTFPALGRLRARLGVFAILGNHDVYTGADDVAQSLACWTDFTVLRDEVATVERGGAELWILGVNDRGMDWARGVRRCRELDEMRVALPPGAPSILLTHRPDLFEQAAKLGIPLVLAGHTHGGQLAIRLRRGRVASLAHFMTRYPRGTYRRGDSVLHVNLGLGVTAQPIRVASPREITVITLRSPSEPV